MHIARTITAMADKIRWGVLGAANIAVEKVIPAMQRGARTRGRRDRVAATRARPRGRRRSSASRACTSSYEALLADPEIDAIYNPLPNHLHVPWSIRAAEAGKHVLCEKPIGAERGRGRASCSRRATAPACVIGEAFMVRSHPQWLRARSWRGRGAIGDLRVVTGSFTYFNRDPRQHPQHRTASAAAALLRHRLLPDHDVAHGLRRGADAGARRCSSATPTSASTGWPR